MKKIIFIAVWVVCIGFISSCHKGSSSPIATGSVMFVHGCASGTATLILNAEVNGSIVAGTGNVSFLGNTGYRSVAPGTGLNLGFGVSGLSSLASRSVSVTAGSNYSAFASGSITSPDVCYTSDDLSAPSSGMAKVRFVNLSPDNLTMNCYAGSAKVDSGLSFNTCSPFFQVAAATLKIGMYDQVNQSYSAIINSQTLAAGKIYTFIFTGTSLGTGTSVYTITSIYNN